MTVHTFPPIPPKPEGHDDNGWDDIDAPDYQPGDTEPTIDDGLQEVNWATMWGEDNDPEWLLEPFIPKGRHVVLFAPAKMGKSLLALEVAAALATGRPIFGNAPAAPVDVTYFDLEMTTDDLRERLADMGYSEDTDLGRLHYYSLPSLPPLDTVLGGDIVLATAKRNGSELVVIDTMARVVAGKENDADTYRLFDMFTSLPLKRAGIAVLRLDHSGKDLEKGQRGSSEKNGYADLVWSLVVTETGQATLRATHKRIGWAPQEVFMQRREEPDLHTILTDNAGLAPGTQDTIDTLERLCVPIDASVRVASAALKHAGEGRRTNIVMAAVRVRRARADLEIVQIDPNRPIPDMGNTAEAHLSDQRFPAGNVSHHPGNTLSTPPASERFPSDSEMPSDQHGKRSGNAGNTTPSPTAEGVSQIPPPRSGGGLEPSSGTSPEQPSTPPRRRPVLPPGFTEADLDADPFDTGDDAA